MDIAKLLENKAKDFLDKPAIVFKEQSISYQQLRDNAFRLAHGLNSLGLRKADKLAVYLPNIPEYIYSFLATFILRSVAVPLDFMLTEEELVNFINHSESKILIAQEKKGVDLAKIKDKCPSLKEIILFGQNKGAGFLSWEELLKQELFLPTIEASDKDYAAIFYTSGSTGHPKGVLLTYAHLENPIQCLDYFIHPTDKDSFLCAGVPFSHIGGLDYMLFMLYFGSTLILMERFQPLEFLKNIEKYRVTIFCIVPSMYVATLSLKEYDKFDLSALKYAVVFGAPSSPELLERFHRAYPNAYLLNGWGMTETAAPNTYLPTGTQTREIEHTGEFMPGTEAKIAEDQELWIRSKAVMAGYYKEPDLTNQVLTADGWLKTGDIAKCDAQGKYSIIGRKKDMIKVSGEIVFSAEVEEAMQRHPQIQEVAIIGIPDKLRGEVPKAFIVLKDGENLEQNDLRYFLRQHLAHFKIPHYFEFKTELPKNRVGKIDKEQLRAI